MTIVVTYSIELNESDVMRIQKRLNTISSLTPFITMSSYLKNRLKDAVMLELQKSYGENLCMRCEQKYMKFESF